MLAILVSLTRTLSSAARVAGAVEVGRAPAARDLERLGIDPERFRAIRHA